MIRAAVERLVQQLEADPRIRLADARIEPPASDAAIEEAREAAGGRLPAGVEAFYRELDGFFLAWERPVEEPGAGDPNDGGCIHLLSIDRVFADPKDAIWFGGNGGGGSRHRPVRPFDQFEPEACAAFYQPEGDAVEDGVRFHVAGEMLAETGHGFEAYLERALAARGFWHWIHTLVAETADSAQAEAFRDKGPRLFPDLDLELFRPG